MNANENRNVAREARRATEHFEALLKKEKPIVTMTCCGFRLSDWPICRHHSQCASGKKCQAVAK
jgi:hypothetical protein